MDDFGGKLRQARERRGISLRQIAGSTKIAAAALEALERNDISKLPGGIFSRAFVRSYAIEVGLDPDETVREFLERFNQDAPPSSETIETAVPEEERDFQVRQRKAIRLAIAFIIAIPIVIALLYTGYRWRAAAKVTAATASATPQPPPAPAQSAPAPPPAAASDAGTPSAAPQNVPPAAAGQLSLEIRPIADCWVSLTIDGKKLFARVMTAGEREAHPVEREAVVEVGDAGSFAYSLNGRPGKPLGDKGQVKTLKVTPATASQYVR